MQDFMQNVVYLYMNAGVLGVEVLVGSILLIWWFTKGRDQKAKAKKELDEKYERRAKQEHEDRQRQIAETAMLKEVLKNNTAVINNNTQVIVKNDAMRQKEVDVLTDLDKKVETMVQNQAICLDRQNRH